MKIKHLLLATFISAAFSIKAQVNEFTWINGSTGINQAAVYGTQGVPSTTNSPGARDYAMTWTDASGNLWLYGGINQSSGYMADMWRYNPTTNEWTWMSGVNSAGAWPYVVTQGVPATTNYPGGRYGACTWTSPDGNTLYLFGGWGFASGGSQGILNNLWAYSVPNNTWVYLKGSLGINQAALYSGAANLVGPGSKQGSVGWTSPAGLLYLFGGSGYASGASSGLTNDLWKYDPATNNWTYINGNTTINPISVNTPGGVTEAVAFYDGVSNKAYVTGGVGRTWNSTAGRLNDMWSFNMTTSTWNFETGNSGNVDDGGVYGTVGVEQAGVFPRARDRAKGVVLKSGRFAYFGGYGWNGSAMDNLGDYWEYNPYTKNWAWMKGNIPTTTNQNGNYGTLGVSSASNMPGERFAASAWRDNQGNLWLYGGTGLGITGTTAGRLSDLWKYEPECNAPAVSPVSTTTASSFCSANAVLTATANAMVTWFATGTSTNVLAYGNSYSPAGLSAGTYTYYAESSNGCGVSPSRTSVSFTINATPTISVNSGVRCAPSAYTIVPVGATSYTVQGGSFVVSPISYTTYTVIGSANGCLSNVVTCSVIPSIKPTISVNSGTICNGSSFTITPGGASTYTIENGNAVVTPTASTSYTVVGMDADGCLSTNTVVSNVTVNALPTVSISSSANSGNICQGQSAVLTAIDNGATAYSWSTGATTNLITVSPAVTTTYSVVVTAATSCTASAVTTLSVNTCTGIHENSGNEILEVYPNPTDKILHFKVLTKDLGTIEITDMNGKTIYSTANNASEQVIDMSDLSTGIYLIKVTINQNTYYKKLVKL